MQLTESSSWIALEKHSNSVRLRPYHCFKEQSDLYNAQLEFYSQGISIDFRQQRVDDTTIELLIALAKERSLSKKISALLLGEKVNTSENRPALHTALRSFKKSPIYVDGCDIIPGILETREKMRSISQQIRDGLWLGFSGQPIKDIVNIGIGGSDFGPRFCVNALASYTHADLNFHFVSDADPRAFENTVSSLKPETTIFIISSKSFTTKETLYNAQKAITWLDNDQHLDKHFIAISANLSKAKSLGFNEVLPIWDWVGGRYSLCSAINLITCIAIGYENFIQLLAGANSMDEHFQHKKLEENMPVMMALIGLWNINFLHIPSLLLLAYAKQLELLVPYVQQLDMESNGKSLDYLGRAVNYSTGPIVWGGLGNQAQHSYYQLLCQGTHKIAGEFISTKEFNNELINNFCDAKMNVLSKGINSVDNPNGYIPGGIPISHISLDLCSPFCLGALIALYEHKVYVQSAIWNINPFDQPGVESAKRQKSKTQNQQQQTQLVDNN